MSLCRKKYSLLFMLFFCLFIFVLTNFNNTILENSFERMKIKTHSQLQIYKTFISRSFKNLYRRIYTNENSSREFSQPACPELPPGLGPLDVDFKINVSIDKIILENLNITFGGHSKPKDCTALQKIAIIIPFRNRELHLTYWLFYMHPFLQKQQGDYGIYVVEQHGQSMFNRAKLMNIGYTEAVKDYDYNCFIFSDVDIIPMNLKNLYRCSKYPKHMAHSLDKFNFRLPYKTLFGGIVAFTKEQYLNINGFSNSFWGWGGEDDELYQRVVAAGMIIERAPQNISKAKMMTHMRDPGNERNQKNVPLISKAKFKMHEDGLSSLEYLLISFTRHRLYTKITVDIGKPDDSMKHSLGGSV